jgi:hypothetical protein
VAEIQLKWIRDEAVANPDPGGALVMKPLVIRQGEADVAVDLVVVRIKQVASQVPRETTGIALRGSQAAGLPRTLKDEKVALAEIEQSPRCAESRRAGAEDQESTPRHGVLSVVAFQRD